MDPTDEVAELYASACPRLIGFLTVVGGSRADAEEVAQEAFVRLLQKWSKIRDYDDPEMWLRTVAVRLLISRHRRHQVARLALPRLARADRSDPDGADDRVDLDAAIARLPLDQRAVVVLHHLDDRPVDEVARIPAGSGRHGEIAPRPRTCRTGPAPPRLGAPVMTDPIRDALARTTAAATPDTAPPFERVLDRRDRRRRRTRGGIAVGAAAAITAGVVFATTTGGARNDRTSPPVASDATRAPAPPTLTPDAFSGNRPPLLVLGGPSGPVDALQGSYCWGNGCVDSVVPGPAAVPDLGTVSPLSAAFPRSDQLSADSVASDNRPRCARYPTLVETDGGGDGTQLLLTPSGPAGDRLASYFSYLGGGDTSGFWRWTVERDGVPLSWVTLSQNSPRSGGNARLAVMVDDAAVDGDVSAAVEVVAADGTRTEILPTRVDQRCAGDGFVELATPYDYSQRRIDGLGPAPYDYTVDLEIDGKTYVGTGTWSDETSQYGGDARLTFEPALPVLQ